MTTSIPAAASPTSSTAAAGGTRRSSTAPIRHGVANGSSRSEVAADSRHLIDRRGPAAAVALCCAIAAAGCGLGPGASIGKVELTVTRDYGTEPVLRKSIDGVRESDTVLRVLDRNTKITTRYGGGFVQSIDGVAGGEPGGHVHDWFFYVNGVESDQGAADYSLHDGDTIWWDYRDWSAAMRVPAVVGSYPAPFREGSQGGSNAVALQCRGGAGACGEVSRRLRDAGAELGAANGDRSQVRVLVGPWTRIRGD